MGLFFPTRGTVTATDCGTEQSMQVMAQAVPSATQLPCVASLPVGWGVGDAEIIKGNAMFIVGVSGGESSPVTVTLTESPPDVEGTQQIPIDGGCVTYRTTVDDPGVPSFAPGGGLQFTSRADLVAKVAEQDDQVLCGALAPPARRYRSWTREGRSKWTVPVSP